jgi:hypothetical protein
VSTQEYKPVTATGDPIVEILKFFGMGGGDPSQDRPKGNGGTP